MDRKINIILVDDNPLFLETMQELLNKSGKFNILACFPSGVELLEYPDLIKCRIVLMDIEMPGLNGIATARIINFMYSHIRLVAVTMYQDRIYLEQLIKVGFKGFINKFELAENLFPVISTVMMNKFSFPSQLKI